VFEELGDDEIVTPPGRDKSDSEEDAEDTDEACNITSSRATLYAD
jgi:hypothetical protein